VKRWEQGEGTEGRQQVKLGSLVGAVGPPHHLISLFFALLPAFALGPSQLGHVVDWIGIAVGLKACNLRGINSSVMSHLWCATAYYEGPVQPAFITISLCLSFHFSLIFFCRARLDGKDAECTAAFSAPSCLLTVVGSSGTILLHTRLFSQVQCSAIALRRPPIPAHPHFPFLVMEEKDSTAFYAQ
jgi:hypothetical protein